MTISTLHFPLLCYIKRMLRKYVEYLPIDVDRNFPCFIITLVIFYASLLEILYKVLYTTLLPVPHIQ